MFDTFISGFDLCLPGGFTDESFFVSLPQNRAATIEKI
jgi:hypothetical protein